MKRSIVALLPLALVAACGDESSTYGETTYHCPPYTVHHMDGAPTAHFVGVHSTSTLTDNGMGVFVSHGQKGPKISFDGNKINRQWRGDYPCTSMDGYGEPYRFNGHANYVPRD